MDKQYIFNFTTDISNVSIPSILNNPFGTFIPEISEIAAQEFQQFIAAESNKWNYDFANQKGKMFGVLVVQNKEKGYSYLGTMSGKLPGNTTCDRFIPSVFDDSIDDYFINRGMKELSEIGLQIKSKTEPIEMALLKKVRKQKSIALQQRLFENYHFLNLSGKEESLLNIFEALLGKTPPAAAGECAAPKLLQYAIEQKLKPIAITEFWWGKSTKSNERKHKAHYPACENKCRPILEYMLEDSSIFTDRV